MISALIVAHATFWQAHPQEVDSAYEQYANEFVHAYQGKFTENKILVIS